MHSHALTSPARSRRPTRTSPTTSNGAANPDPLQVLRQLPLPNVARGPCTVPPTLPVRRRPPNWKDGVSCTTATSSTATPRRATAASRSRYQGSGYQTGFVPAEPDTSASSTRRGRQQRPRDATATATTSSQPQQALLQLPRGLDRLQPRRRRREGPRPGPADDVGRVHRVQDCSAARRAASRATCPSTRTRRASPTARRSPASSSRLPRRASSTTTRSSASTSLSTTPAQQQATLAARTALLQSAAFFQIDRKSSSASATTASTSTSSSPTPAPATTCPRASPSRGRCGSRSRRPTRRQRALPVRRAQTNRPTTSATADSLYEFGNPMPRFFQNCLFTDNELTTFQQKLVNLADLRVRRQRPVRPCRSDQGRPDRQRDLAAVPERRRRRAAARTSTAVVQRPQAVRSRTEFHYDRPERRDRAGSPSRRTCSSASCPRTSCAPSPTTSRRRRPQLAPLIANIQTILMATDQLSL